MFEWLVDEMASVNTRKFYVTDGPLPAQTRKAMEGSNVPVPPSYRAFILRFGNANFYRQGSVYLVRVFAAPRLETSEDGEELLHFGRTDLALAYFKRKLLAPGRDTAVFEWRHHQGFRRVAEGFEEWLQSRCRTARRRFKASHWKAIQQGPSPFSQRELAIVEARKKFRWQVVGVTEDADVLFEVHNGSELVLPYLSIGIRRKGGEPIGGVWLPIQSILPGQTRSVVKDCYKQLLLPEEIEAFDAPDPAPEDRDRYWEFRELPCVARSVTR